MEHHLTDKVHVNGTPSEATLTAEELQWRHVDAGGGHQSLSLEAEVLGVEVKGKELVVKAFIADDAVAVSCVGAGNARVGGGRIRKDYVLAMAGEDTAAIWGDKLKGCIDSFGRPKRLFIFVNPFGGKKCAPEIYETEVKPLLEAADVEITMQETKHQLHAQEVASSLDLANYDGIVCVSGDGILVEVVNGLLHREDWHEATKKPVGVIPAGTGNGMAKSLLHSVGDMYSVANAVFAIIRGHKRSLDVSTIVQGDQKFFSVLLLTWGLVADIDIESEKYRWMGSARLDVYSLIRIVNLRKYSGRIQFVPAPGYEGVGEPIKQDDSTFQEFHGHHGKSSSNSYQGPSVQFQSSEWRCFDGPFIAVWLNNVPWCTESLMAAPEAKFSDGYLDAVIVRDCPKLSLLSLLLKMSDGSYIKSPHVTYLKVKAFRLAPGHLIGDPKKSSIIDVDGEVIARDDDNQKHLMAYGPPIQMTIDQGLATIFAPR